MKMMLDDIEWAPRVPQQKIRRLYESDARGLLDEDLLDEVGMTLYLRCQSILDIEDAHHGRVKCPRCAKKGGMTIIERVRRKGDPRDVQLACPACGWTATWGEYARSFRRKQLNPGGAVSTFRRYVRQYPLARAAKDKLLAIDQLIHEFHYSLRSQPDLPTRPVCVNLIEGRLGDVVQFLDDLTYGDETSSELQAGRQAWQQTLETWRGLMASWSTRDDR